MSSNSPIRAGMLFDFCRDITNAHTIWPIHSDDFLPETPTPHTWVSQHLGLDPRKGGLSWFGPASAFMNRRQWFELVRTAVETRTLSEGLLPSVSRTNEFDKVLDLFVGPSGSTPMFLYCFQMIWRDHAYFNKHISVSFGEDTRSTNRPRHQAREFPYGTRIRLDLDGLVWMDVEPHRFPAWFGPTGFNDHRDIGFLRETKIHQLLLGNGRGIGLSKSQRIAVANRSLEFRPFLKNGGIPPALADRAHDIEPQNHSLIEYRPHAARPCPVLDAQMMMFVKLWRARFDDNTVYRYDLAYTLERTTGAIVSISLTVSPLFLLSHLDGTLTGEVAHWLANR